MGSRGSRQAPLRCCPGRGPCSQPECNHGSQVPAPLHFSSYGGARGLDPLAPAATVAASSCPAGSNPRSHCLISGTGLGSHRALPVQRPPPLLKSGWKRLLVKLVKPLALANPVPRGRSSTTASPALWVSRSGNQPPPVIAETLLLQCSSQPRNMPHASPYFLQSLQ